jgi:hypothetical protein
MNHIDKPISVSNLAILNIVVSLIFFSLGIHAEPLNKSNTSGTPSNYRGPVANYPPSFKIGEKWIYSDQESCEVVKTGPLSTIFFCHRNGTNIPDSCTDTYEELTPNLDLIFLRNRNFAPAVDCYKWIADDPSFKFPLWIGKHWSYEIQVTNNQVQAAVEGQEQLVISGKSVSTFRIVYATKNLAVQNAPWNQMTIWYSPKHKQYVKIISKERSSVLTNYISPR